MNNTANRPVRVTITVEATPRSETREIDRAEWDARSPAQRRAYLDEMAMDELNNAGGYGWSIADPNDEADTED